MAGGVWYCGDSHYVDHNSLTFFVIRHGWRYHLALAVGATSVFLLFDGLLVISCSFKIIEGGWFPLALGAAIFTIMATVGVVVANS